MLPVALLAVTIPQNNLTVDAVAVQPTATAQPVFSNGTHALLAQSIIPDDTTTVVSPLDNQIDITGGHLSGDGINLFHNFQQFGLSDQQTANFIANPQVQNVLGRVLGGEASYIDGILRVSNSDANLYLVNPAGILFGHNAQLDLTGSFTAATADRVGFEGGWWDSLGTSDYSELVGDPSQFSFSAFQPGSVVNLGNLAVNENQDITLLGGNVVNTGSVSAPGGRITLAAITGPKTVTLGSANGLLTMELSPQAIDQTLSPLSLPQLLTGGAVHEDSNLVVSADGIVSLQGVAIPEDGGTTAVAGDLNVADRQGGEINLFGPRVAVVEADVDASGVTGGGTTRIGGGYQGNDNVPNAALTYIDAESTIDVSGGETGDGGLTVVWADGLTKFYGNVDASGGRQSGDGGFVEISGKNSLVYQGSVDLSALAGNTGTLLLDPQNITIIDGNAGSGINDANLGVGPNALVLSTALPNEFQISRGTLESFTGSVVLAATNSITLNDLAGDSLDLQADSIRFDAGDIGSFAMDTSDTIRTNGGSVTIWANTIDLGNIDTAGGDIALFESGVPGGNLTLQADSEISTGVGPGNIVINGDINGNHDLTLTAGTGQVQLNGVVGNSTRVSDFEINAADIQFNELASFRDITFNGPVTLTGDTLVNPGGGSFAAIFNDDVNGNHTLTIQGNADIQGDVGNLVPLSSFNLNGSTLFLSSLGRDITTDGGDIDLNSSLVQLTNDITLDTGGSGGDILFFTVRGDNVVPRSLTLQAGLGDIDGSFVGSASGIANNITLAGNQVEINNVEADGNVVVNAQAGVEINNGDFIVGNDLTVTSQGDIVLNNGEVRANGDISLTATETVQIQDSSVTPAILEAGNNVTIRGDQGIAIQTTNNTDSRIQSIGGDTTLISDGSILGNARFITGGIFAAETVLGDPGNFITSFNSLISSVGNVSFGNYEGPSLKVESQGSITGQAITITDANTFLTGLDSELSILAAGPAVILRAGVPVLENAPNVPSGGTLSVGETAFNSTVTQSTPANITVGDIETSNAPGAVLLSATGSITSGDITLNSGPITLESTGDIQAGDIFTDGNNVPVILTSTAGNIEVETINHDGSNDSYIDISAAGTFRATDTFGANFTSLGTEFPRIQNLPVSVRLAFSSRETPITIRYNGAVEADPDLTVVSTHPILGGQTISIGGQGAPLSVGPDVVGDIDPDALTIDNSSNEFYAPRPVPDGVSGTAGAIAIGGGSNGNLFTSVQDIPFIDEGEPPVVDDGVDPPVVVIDDEVVVIDDEIVTDNGADIQANEEQVDRQVSLAICDDLNGELVAQAIGSRGGDGTDGTAPGTNIETTERETAQRTNRDLCGSPESEETILDIDLPGPTEPPTESES